MTGVLYISYDGMLEPLGQSQVLAYLERLAPEFAIHLVSFEKPEDWANAKLRDAVTTRMVKAGIVWHPLRYHKRPSAPATAYDIVQGIRLGRRLVRRHALSIIHARSYVPSVIALVIKRLTGARYLFDMRGFWADERVDGGIWPRDGRLYKFAKGFERRFLLAADAVVSLTHAAKRSIEEFPYLEGRVPPIRIIPTCADLERFQPASAPPKEPFTLGYVGTVGNWYDLKRSAELFLRLRASLPSARLLVVNRGEHPFVRRTLSDAGIIDDCFEIVAADHSMVPALIRRMSAGILIAKPAYSHVARAPTKLAEFLGCGVPCLINSGVGDTEKIIVDNNVGVVVREFSEQACVDAVRALLALVDEPNVAARCAAAARQNFSLDEGVLAYAEIYRALGIENQLSGQVGSGDLLSKFLP